MNIVDNSLKTVDNTLSGILSNPMYYGVLAIFLAMYGPRLSPKLPTPVRQLFNNNYFRFAVILLVIFMSSQDLSLALIITIGFVIVMSLANSQEIEEQFTQNNKEGFSDFDSIREFYEDDDEDEGFENNPPENSPENNVENFESTEEEEKEFFENPEEENELFESTPEDENKELFETFENPEEEDELFESTTEEENNEFFEGEEEQENFLNSINPSYEKFSDYEKHLRNVVETYKYK